MDTYVLDTYALMSYFQDESSAATVEMFFIKALENQAAVCISLINAGELYYMTSRRRGSVRANEVWADLQRLPITVHPISQARVLAAARIKANHRISYADAFSIALAQELNATVVTGDPEFRDIEALVPVMWLI